MRQVPHYAIIGNGRMATHLCHYFQALGLSYRQWSRANESEPALKTTLSQATHVLILITDSAIDAFITTYLRGTDKIRVHFSGALLSKYAYTAHPLQTFGNELYEINQYRQIPFIIEAEGLSFSELLPGLDNPHYVIPREAKAYYHSLCVIANNFTTLLWQKFFSALENKFNIPSSIAHPMLVQTFINIKKDYQAALTGPLARADLKTLSDNINALRNDPFQIIYQAFVDAYLQENA